jgi:hypothetical protein
MTNITIQLPLRPPLSTVIGNVDYTRFRLELARTEELLAKSGAEKDFIERSIKQYVARAVSAGTKVNQARLLRHQTRSVIALRSMLLMSILGEDFRGMSWRLAECQPYMKKLVLVITEHAQRHLDLLDREWDQTHWTHKQAEQVLRRIHGVLELLPKAQKQAADSQRARRQ